MAYWCENVELKTIDHFKEKSHFKIITYMY